MSAADVVGILGFALHAAHKIYNAVQEVRQAPQDIKALQDEAFRVRQLLERFGVKPSQEEQCGEPGSHAELRQFIELSGKGEELIAAAGKFIEKATVPGMVGTRKVKKIKWLLKGSCAKELAQEFKAFHRALTDVCSINTYFGMRSVESRISAMGNRTVSAVGEHTTQMERLFATHEEEMKQFITQSLATVSRQQREGRHQLFDELSTYNGPEVAQGPPSRQRPWLINWNMDSSVYDKEPASLRLTGDSSTQTTPTTEASREPDAILQHRLTSYSRFKSPTRMRRCALNCQCRCHRSTSTYRPVPHAFKSWLGDIRVHEGFLTSLISSTRSCDDITCMQTRDSLSTVKWLLPRWFAETEFKIRFQSLPVQFVIQTPRVVESLQFLLNITFEELKVKLSTRELTVNDIEESGNSVLHYMAFKIIFQDEYAHEMTRYLLDVGAPHDWEYHGLTVTEYVTDTTRYWFGNSKWAATFFSHNVAKPLLGEDMEDTWETIREKRKWSDLHYLLANPPSSHALLKSELTRILDQPGAAFYLNAKDRFGRTPLKEAIFSCPSAVDALLRAGANPHLIDGSPFVDVAIVASSTAISPLVRAGEEVNERLIWFNDLITTPLHDIIPADPGPGRRLSSALELVRHAGHLLDWDIEDDLEGTPLDAAEWLVETYPDDEEVASVYQIYKTREVRVPCGAQLIDRSRLVEGEKIVSDLESTSLINAGLQGNVEAIGILIDAGAMVNERDAAGRTLLHLVAMGVVADGYAVALEIMRYGGYGVDWDALTVGGETAEELAEGTVRLSEDAYLSGENEECNLKEAIRILELLHSQVLPEGVDYIYPCMHPEYCWTCSARPCSGYCSNGLRMPGQW